MMERDVISNALRLKDSRREMVCITIFIFKDYVNNVSPGLTMKTRRNAAYYNGLGEGEDRGIPTLLILLIYFLFIAAVNRSL
jgi:hypothetical protein